MPDTHSKKPAYRQWLWIISTLISGSAMLWGLYLWMHRLNTNYETKIITYAQYQHQVTITSFLLYLSIVMVVIVLATILLKWSQDTQTQHQWLPKRLQANPDVTPKHTRTVYILSQRLKYGAWVLAGLALITLTCAGIQFGPILF